MVALPMPASVTPWSASQRPQEHEVLAAMRAEGLTPYRWDNGPSYVYAAHEHPYFRYIAFILPDTA